MSFVTDKKSKSRGKGHLSPQLITETDWSNPLHSGWIIKEGVNCKSLKRRFFILQGNKMIYFKSDDINAKIRPIGFFILEPGSTVSLTPLDIKEKDLSNLPRWRVVTPIRVWKFTSETTKGMNDWIAAISKVLYPNYTFGMSLYVVLSKDRAQGWSLDVPKIVYTLIQYLRDAGAINHEGIFRLSANKSELNQLIYKINTRPVASIILDKDTDLHMIAGTLKAFLRELEEPLLPSNCSDAIFKPSLVGDLQVSKIRELLSSLPSENYLTLKYVVRYLFEVSLNSEKNKMTSNNLTVIFTPCIFQSTFGHNFKLMKLLIGYFDLIFDDNSSCLTQSLVPFPDTSFFSNSYLPTVPTSGTNASSESMFEYEQPAEVWTDVSFETSELENDQYFSDIPFQRLEISTPFTNLKDDQYTLPSSMSFETTTEMKKDNYSASGSSSSIINNNNNDDDNINNNNNSNNIIINDNNSNSNSNSNNENFHDDSTSASELEISLNQYNGKSNHCSSENLEHSFPPKKAYSASVPRNEKFKWTSVRPRNSFNYCSTTSQSTLGSLDSSAENSPNDQILLSSSRRGSTSARDLTEFTQKCDMKFMSTKLSKINIQDQFELLKRQSKEVSQNQETEIIQYRERAVSHIQGGKALHDQQRMVQNLEATVQNQGSTTPEDRGAFQEQELLNQGNEYLLPNENLQSQSPHSESLQFKEFEFFPYEKQTQMFNDPLNNELETVQVIQGDTETQDQSNVSYLQKSSDDQGDIDKFSLENFFASLPEVYSQYLKVFKDQGFTSVSELFSLSESDYKELGVLMAHRKNLISTLKKLV